MYKADERTTRGPGKECFYLPFGMKKVPLTIESQSKSALSLLTPFHASFVLLSVRASSSSHFAVNDVFFHSIGSLPFH